MLVTFGDGVNGINGFSTRITTDNTTIRVSPITCGGLDWNCKADAGHDSEDGNKIFHSDELGFVRFDGTSFNSIQVSNKKVVLRVLSSISETWFDGKNKPAQ
ncbi:hypothetical protein SAMN02745166_04982 [Prosthecobacter debontii]|uniref:Uncharacterized protein n=1 Tax=Prosthecobacter debontii TaxID=48467 RepID=A0A1T4Z3I4_9BACT|nr:hypothetical protein SAMN02745166_04982 [Prosthecobacter debontii]